MTRFVKFAALVLLLSQPATGADTTLYGNVKHTDRSDHVVNVIQKHAPSAIPANSVPKAPAPAPTFQAEDTLLTPPTTLSSGAQSNAQAEDTLPPDPLARSAQNKLSGVAHPNSELPTEHPTPVLKAGTAVTNYNVEWFRIPQWMAGSWVKDGDMTTEETDLRTGASSRQQIWTENRLQVNWGHQMDAKGNIWHVNLLPSERDGVSAGKQVRFLTLKQKCENFDNSQLITRTFYAVGEYSGFRGEQVDAFQQESLNHYALDQRGTLVNSSSNRVFNYAGIPVRDGHLVSNFRKTGEFRSLENMRGVDLKDALKDYLLSQGWNELVPQSTEDQK